jgi:hypothetical protein
MSISYSHDERPVLQPKSMRSIQVLTCLNLAVAMVFVLAWNEIGHLLKDPIAWATWHPFHHSGFGLDIFAYPFVLLWGLPMAGAVVGWVGTKSRRRGLAFASLLLPILMLTFIFGCYHVLPPEMR